eukprot:620159_1
MTTNRSIIQLNHQLRILNPMYMHALSINSQSNLPTSTQQNAYITQVQLQSLIVEAYRTATFKYGNDDLHSIKRFVLDEVSAYLLDVDIADKRIDQAFALLANQTTSHRYNIKYFAITSLFSNIKSAKIRLTTRITNKIFADLKSKSIESFNDLKTAKKVDLQTGYPILSWFLDMYSRDRISNAFNINASFNRRYDISRWFNDNLFARYVLYTDREVAQKLKRGMIALSKYVLPPIELHNIRYKIADKLNAFAGYVIA